MVDLLAHWLTASKVYRRLRLHLVEIFVSKSSFMFFIALPTRSSSKSPSSSSMVTWTSLGDTTGDSYNSWFRYRLIVFARCYIGLLGRFNNFYFPIAMLCPKVFCFRSGLPMLSFLSGDGIFIVLDMISFWFDSSAAGYNNWLPGLYFKFSRVLWAFCDHLSCIRAI